MSPNQGTSIVSQNIMLTDMLERAETQRDTLENVLAKWGEARLKLRDLQESPDKLWAEHGKSAADVITQAFRAVDDEMHEVLCLAIEIAQTRRDAKK